MTTTTTSVLPLLVLLPLRRPPSTTTPSHTHTHFSNPIFCHTRHSCSSFNSSTTSTTRRFPNKATNNGPGSDSQNPLFLDQNNAVVDDMDGYLNNLSLEYDSVWDTKPSWCQPWTITLTGVSIISISWLILHSAIVTSLISLLISAWWYIFLYSYPKTYSDMIAKRRERVTNGDEDTFGRRKKQ